MARQIEIGLRYFPMSTGIFNDRKIRRLLKTFGAKGYLIYNFVLCEIYKDKGYFVQCDDDFLFDIADNLAIDENLVKEVINFCVSNVLFDKRVFDVEKVLTSAGIQQRYIEVKSRSGVSILDCYKINAAEKPINATLIPINAAEKPINVALIPQKKRKEKESKEKKRKEKEIKLPFTSEKFIETWDILISTKKWKKKSLQALQMSLNQLGKYDEEFSILLMERSISNDYQGVVFENTDENYKKWLFDKEKKEKEKSPAQKEKEKKEQEEFGRFWNEYQGNKGGVQFEFDNLKKHKDWEDVIQKLLPALENEIYWRKLKQEEGCFVPDWAGLSKWIDQRRWEQGLNFNNNGNSSNKSKSGSGVSDAYKADILKRLLG